MKFKRSRKKYIDYFIKINKDWTKNAKIEMFYIEVAIKKKNDEPQTITISKEDMLKVPSEFKQSELNNDHGNDKENEDNDEAVPVKQIHLRKMMALLSHY